MVLCHCMGFGSIGCVSIRSPSINKPHFNIFNMQMRASISKMCVYFCFHSRYFIIQAENIVFYIWIIALTLDYMLGNMKKSREERKKYLCTNVLLRAQHNHSTEEVELERLSEKKKRIEIFRERIQSNSTLLQGALKDMSVSFYDFVFAQLHEQWAHN